MLLVAVVFWSQIGLGKSLVDWRLAIIDLDRRVLLVDHLNRVLVRDACVRNLTLLILRDRHRVASGG